MTTIAIVAGMIPIAFGRGAGAGSRASMAVTIIGGQVLCLLLTLLVTPVVYSVLRRPPRMEGVGDPETPVRPLRRPAGDRAARSGGLRNRGQARTFFHGGGAPTPAAF